MLESVRRDDNVLSSLAIVSSTFFISLLLCAEISTEELGVATACVVAGDEELLLLLLLHFPH